MIKNFGFNPDFVTIKESDYIFGSALELNVIQEDGQWDEYLPIYEPQAEDYETSGCTVWGGQNQIETYFKKVFGFEPNFAERFNYILAGVTLAGANPQKAYESFRKDGCIDNKFLPNPPTYEEFKNRNDIDSYLIEKGKSWIDVYSIKHEWLKKPSKEDIKEALKYSPIAIGVSAWYLSNDGLYIDNNLKNNHWCLCYGYIETAAGILLKIFDSYDHSHKILHAEHRISIGKRILITKRTKPRKESWRFFEFIKDFFTGSTFGVRRSSYWRQIRRDHLKENPVCAITGSKKKLQVHHKKPVHLFPELELDPKNLITLRKDAHFLIGHLGSYHSHNTDIDKDADYLSKKIKNRP